MLSNAPLVALGTIAPARLVMTGIPPHILNMTVLQDIVKMQTETLKLLQDQDKSLRICIKDALNARDKDNGILSAHALDERLTQHTKTIATLLKNAVTMQAAAAVGSESLPPRGDDSSFETPGPHGHQVYCFKGGFWQLPDSFKIPMSTQRRDAWYLWWLGRSGFKEGDVAAPVRPIRAVTPVRVHDPVVRKVIYHFKTCFEMMEQAPGLELPEKGITPTRQWCDLSYEVASDYIKNTRASFLYSATFEVTGDHEATGQGLRKKIHPERFHISTWGKVLKQGHINIYGTPTDKVHASRSKRRGRYNTSTSTEAATPPP